MQMQLKLESRFMTTRRYFMNVSTGLALAVALAGSTGLALAQKPPVTLLNVSYDPTITFVQRNVGDVLQARTKYASQFPKLTLFTIDQGFGGWTKADKDHFADGASFDQIYTQK